MDVIWWLKRQEALMVAPEILSESRADGTKELLTEWVRHEIFDVHNRSIVFSGEPTSTLALFGFAKVARITSRCFCSSAIVLPKTIFQERLRELDLRKLTVGWHADGDRRTEESPSVYDSQERYLLLPNFNHGVIESRDVFLTLLDGLLFGDICFHGAKVRDGSEWAKDEEM